MESSPTNRPTRFPVWVPILATVVVVGFVVVLTTKTPGQGTNAAPSQNANAGANSNSSLNANVATNANGSTNTNAADNQNTNSQSALQTYTDATNGFQVRYPHSWQAIKETSVVTGFGPPNKQYLIEGGTAYAVSVGINYESAASYVARASASRVSNAVVNGNAAYKVLEMDGTDYAFVIDLQNGKSVTIAELVNLLYANGEVTTERQELFDGYNTITSTFAYVK